MPFAAIDAGDLKVRFTADPPTLHVETQKGVAIQRLRLDAGAPAVAFSLGKGPLLGFGEGGPQFDRKGVAYTNRNGQGGYQLRTHGGRVPIQWLVGTDGWGLFIHHPLGAFDLTGADRHAARRPTAALPLDVFVTASRDPKAIMAEYARITGFAELPPLWSFGYMQSHRTLAGPDEIDVGRADVPREEAAVRCADLSRHRVHAVGMEHAQRRVRMEDRELPRPEALHRRRCTRSTTRSCCTSSSRAGG